MNQSAWHSLLLPQGGAPDSAPVTNGDAPNQSSNDAKDTQPMDDTPDKHDNIPTDDAASKEVRPLYELSMVGKCECSACISSVAAKYTQVRTWHVCACVRASLCVCMYSCVYALHVYVYPLSVLQDNFRLLDPTDPFGNQLELLDTGTGSTQSAKSFSGETLPKFPITTDIKGPLTCVHVANMGPGKGVRRRGGEGRELS